MEEFKHVCRLCNKRYPSGKSLGGHMRSHVVANSNASSPPSPLHKLKKPNNKKPLPIGYGLRKNPRKTWRVVDLDTPTLVTPNQQERVCKQCGKAFLSSKALGGHMSSHSSRERSFRRFDDDDNEDEEDEDDDSWASEEEDEEELAMESHSDSVVEADQSKKARYKAIAVIDSCSPVKGCSSNNSGIEHEQEEVALCLMMLSRDSATRVGFNFTAESSDNNSVILEGGSSSTYAAKRKNLNSISDIDNIGASLSVKANPVARKRVKCLELDNSDSGYFENGAKELESDDSVGGYARHYGIKRPKVEYDIEFGDRFKNRVALVEDGDEEVNAQLKKFLQNSRGFGGSKKPKIDDLSRTKSPQRSSHKAGKYQCSICQRTFKTHQTLGGHILTHRRGSKNEKSIDTSDFASKQALEFDSNSGKISVARSVNVNDVDKKALMGSKKTKGHCCPYCPKVFRSGQALGGHKRSHMTGCSSRDKASLIKSVEENPPENHRLLLDLNLPAPVDEDSNGVMPW